MWSSAWLLWSWFVILNWPPLFTLMEIYCLAPATLGTDTCHTRSYICNAKPQFHRIECHWNHSASHAEYKSKGITLEPWEGLCACVCVCVCVCVCSSTLVQIHLNHWDQNSELPVCQPSCLSGLAVWRVTSRAETDTQWPCYLQTCRAESVTVMIK